MKIKIPVKPACEILMIWKRLQQNVLFNDESHFYLIVEDEDLNLIQKYYPNTVVYL